MTSKQIMRIHTTTGVEENDAILDQVVIADDLLRMEATMSKNQISEHLGISKATLYEWRKQEQIE